MKTTDRKSIADGRLALTGLGLGGAALAGLYQAVSDQEARETLRAAWAAGLRYIDTAPYYGHGLSEQRMGAFLREQPRDSFVISTKVGRLLRPDGRVQPMDNGWAAPLPFRPVYDYSYDGVMRSFEDSLQRLGLARIDLLFVHDIGPYTHGDGHAPHWQALTRGRGFRALEELRESGRIQAFGLGVNEAQVVHDAMQEVRLDCSLLAGRYTLLEQHSLPLLQACQRQGHAVVVGGPFNSGLLAGNGKFDYADAPAEILARAQALRAACAEFGVPLQAAALQFPLAHPAVVSVLSGMRSAAQVRENVGWFEQAIPPEMWLALRERGLIDPEAPLPVTSNGPWRVDAHQHFWRLADRVGQWPPASLAAIHRDFGPADLEPLRQRAGVDGTVLVQSLPSEEDTRWMLSVAEQHPSVWGVVGWTDLKAPDAPARIEALAVHPKLRGLRPMLQDLSEDDWIADSAVDAAARAMVAHGLVFDALVLPRHLDALEVFTALHPDLPVVIDHGAKPPIATGELEPWRSRMARLAARPQVCCKVSGLLTEAGHRANAEALRPYVRALIELFGPQRLLWGSDWPVLCLAGDYGSWLDMSHTLVETLAPGLTDADRAAVFGGNAVRVYGLKPC